MPKILVYRCLTHFTDLCINFIYLDVMEMGYIGHNVHGTILLGTFYAKFQK